MKSKKIIAGLLSFVIAATTISTPLGGTISGVFDNFSLSASAETFGDYEYYALDDERVRITSYEGSDAEIELPSEIDGKKVVGITSNAFNKCTTLTSVIIPEGIESIGKGAFMNCTNLKNVKIPNTVTIIGEEAFSYCYKLTSITIPDSVITIDKSAFYNCRAAESITIGNSVTSIGYNAFCLCDNVESIVIPDSVTTIGASAFKLCRNLINATIGKGVSSINTYAFSECLKLKSITVDPENEYYSTEDGILFSKDKTKLIIFPIANEITSYEIPNNVTSIEKRAFSYCSGLTSIIIPESITTIDEWTFSSCKNLTSITLPQSIASIKEHAFYGCESLPEITIPKSVTSIGDGIFYECKSLKNIEIPDSVESMGDGVFMYCSSLPSVILPDTLTKIGDHTFYYCTNLSNITIPSNVTSIGYSAFENCTNLTGITIPSNVTSIGQSAFEDCTNLTSITIPSSVASIAKSAFENCQNLKSVYYSGTKDEWNSVTIGDSNDPLINAYKHYIMSDYETEVLDDGTIEITKYNGSATELEIPSEINGKKVTSIGESAFWGSANLTSVTIPNGVTSIKSWAFYGCPNLTSVKIPDSVTSIGDSAFYGCTNLTSVKIPDSVTSIETSAFYGCTNLTSVTISDKVESIGIGAFAGCSSLTSIEVDSNNQNYLSKDGVLFNKDQTVLIQYPAGKEDTSYIVPKSATIISRFAFLGSKNLTSVTLPDGMQSIGIKVFDSCSALKNITIPDSVTYIRESAFNECNSLNAVCYSGSKEKWNNIVIDGSNDPLINAHKYYNLNNYETQVLDDGTIEIIGYRTSIEEELEIPPEIDGKRVTRIGDNAFRGYLMTSVTIPESVTNIGLAAFATCSNIISFTVDENNKNYSSKDGIMFNKDQTELVQYPCGKKETSYSVPDNVTSIGNYAFSGCENLTSVTLTDNVTSIGQTAFLRCTNLTNVTISDKVESIGEGVFAGCSSLTSIEVDSNNKNYLSKDGVLFTKDQTTLIQYPAGKKDTSYSVPNNVTSIGICAFAGCENLTSVTLPDGIKHIEVEAFTMCPALTSITIPDSVTDIGIVAFYGCDKLDTVYYSGTEDEWNNIEMGYLNNTLNDAYKYYNMSRSVLHQKKLDNTAVRFLYLADIDDVTKANKADVTFKGDRIAVGTESITKAYRSVIAGGKKVTAPEGKCYLVTSPMYLNEVSSEWAAEFALYENDAVTKQSQGICKIG